MVIVVVVFVVVAFLPVAFLPVAFFPVAFVSVVASGGVGARGSGCRQLGSSSGAYRPLPEGLHRGLDSVGVANWTSTSRSQVKSLRFNGGGDSDNDDVGPSEAFSQALLWSCSQSEVLCG